MSRWRKLSQQLRQRINCSRGRRKSRSVWCQQNSRKNNILWKSWLTRPNVRDRGSDKDWKLSMGYSKRMRGFFRWERDRSQTGVDQIVSRRKGNGMRESIYWKVWLGVSRKWNRKLWTFVSPMDKLTQQQCADQFPLSEVQKLLERLLYPTSCNETNRESRDTLSP